MKLVEIDKARYRKHLNIVFVGMAAFTLVIALGTSALLIHFFSTPEQSHFAHNLIGVVIAAAIVVYALLKLREHPFMKEVVYVWDLKQILNRIHRKQRKLQSAVEANDHDALIIMNYQYRGSKHLYQLDDNTITIDELVNKIFVHDKLLEAAGLTTSTDTFSTSMLDKF